ncbi:MAG: hypothetical protein KJO07_01670 [Deltaproteobacteria bacterium]|nr:hypothetical protein [Deltaproteobacteria bacterium]
MRASFALVLLATLGLASNAAAECAAPRIQLSPGTGSVVGEKLRVYAFVPEYAEGGEIVVLGDGRALEYRDTVVSTSDGLSTLAIDIDATGKNELEVTMGSAKATYQVRELNKRREIVVRRTEATIAPVSASHVSDAWTCSHTEARTIEMSGLPADAYQVDRAPTLDALRSGDLTTVVLPPSMSEFWRWGTEDAPEITRAKLVLGHASCFGETANEADIKGTFYVRITPLYHNGRGPSTGAYVVERDRVYPAADPKVAAIAEPAPRMTCGLAYQYQNERKQRRWRLAWLLSAFSGLLMGVAFAWARARRYRRRWVAVVGLLGLGNAGLLSVLAVVSTWTVTLATGALVCALVGGLAFGAFARRRGNR